jgi:hypothetical protein
MLILSLDMIKQLVPIRDCTLLNKGDYAKDFIEILIQNAF